MALTQTEFETLLTDTTKRIEGDIAWQADEDHSPSMDFRAEVRSDSGWPLFVRGSFNPLIPALSYNLILKTEGRVYGLDLGKDHHNPQCHQVGECHKHRWTEQFRDKEAYEPTDITASPAHPVGCLGTVLRRGWNRPSGADAPSTPANRGLVPMNATTLCADLQREMGELFSCAPQGEFQRIRTPYLYPDGDNIDLFLKTAGGVTTVSDLGETLRWLRSQTLSPRRSPKQNALIADACLTHGAELYKGMLLARCRPADSLAGVITRVAQACLRVSDLWFTFRTRAVESVTDEVADFLSERQVKFDHGPKYAGRSGRSWTVDFHVRAPQRSSLVYVLSTGSRSAARSVAEHVLAAWYDLSHLSAGPEALRFVSLFDDTADVWADEDFRLVEPLSTVARWSQPDGFTQVLAEAA